MSSKTIKRLSFLLAVTSGLLSTPAVTFAFDKSAVSIDAPANELVNGLFAQQWVTPNAAGEIKGSVVGLSVGDKTPVNGLPVVLVRDGVVEAKTLTNAQGGFTLPSVKPGSYSILVRDANTIGAFSLQVVAGKDARSLGSEVEVRVIKPAAKVNEILETQSLPSYAMRASNAVPSVGTDPLGQMRTFAKSQAVAMDASGNLTGRIGTATRDNDMSDMTVIVMKDGVEVAKAGVARDGSYSVAGLNPGVYGFVAVGGSGFAAMSFELVKNNVETLPAQGKKLISSYLLPSPSMNVEVAPVEMMAPQTEEVVEYVDGGEVIVDNPAGVSGFGGGGGYGGGSGGGMGGGGGGGMGGWAGLAGIAGLATVAGIVAADNGDDAPIASPN